MRAVFARYDIYPARPSVNAAILNTGNIHKYLEILSIEIFFICCYLFITVVDYGPAEESFAAGAAEAAKVVASGDIATNAADFRRFRGCIISATGRGRSSRIHLFRLFSVHTSNKSQPLLFDNIGRKEIDKETTCIRGSKSRVCQLSRDESEWFSMFLTPPCLTIVSSVSRLDLFCLKGLLVYVTYPSNEIRILLYLFQLPSVLPSEGVRRMCQSTRLST